MKRRGLLALSIVLGGAALAAMAWNVLRPVEAIAAREAPKATAVPVQTVTATREDLPIAERAIGWVEPIAQVPMVSRIDSQILQQLVSEGQEVKAGDLLFKLDDRDLAATLERDRALLAKDQAMAERASRDEERAKKLLATNAGSQQALDIAVAESRAAAAAVLADQATVDSSQVQLSYTEIRAPIDGRLGEIAVSPGDFVKANDATQPLVTITQMKPVYVTFTLPDRLLDKLRAALAETPDLPARIFVNSEDEAKATGKVTFLDSTVDRTSGTITVKATVANETLALWPGQYVDVALDLGKAAGTTVVPTVSLQPGRDGPYLFVVDDEGHASQRSVVVAGTVGAKTAIASGVEPGEAVVVEGQAQLTDGVAVTSGQ